MKPFEKRPFDEYIKQVDESWRKQGIVPASAPIRYAMACYCARKDNPSNWYYRAFGTIEAYHYKDAQNQARAKLADFNWKNYSLTALPEVTNIGEAEDDVVDGSNQFWENVAWHENEHKRLRALFDEVGGDEHDILAPISLWSDEVHKLKRQNARKRTRIKAMTALWLNRVTKAFEAGVKAGAKFALEFEGTCPDCDFDEVCKAQYLSEGATICKTDIDSVADMLAQRLLKQSANETKTANPFVGL